MLTVGNFYHPRNKSESCTTTPVLHPISSKASKSSSLATIQPPFRRPRKPLSALRAIQPLQRDVGGMASCLPKACGALTRSFSGRRHEPGVFISCFRVRLCPCELYSYVPLTVVPILLGGHRRWQWTWRTDESGRAEEGNADERRIK